eukprot:9137129-Lingulodinium_polyedra.AAC.1
MLPSEAMVVNSCLRAGCNLLNLRLALGTGTCRGSAGAATQKGCCSTAMAHQHKSWEKSLWLKEPPAPKSQRS